MEHYLIHNKPGKERQLFALLFLMALCPLLTGANSFNEPEERHEWPIEYIAQPEVEFLNVKILQAEHGSLYVSGRARRAYGSGEHGGYVTLNLFAPGSSTAGFTGSSAYLPLASTHRSHGQYFRIDIPLLPKQGSKIVLQYIKKEHSENEERVSP